MGPWSPAFPRRQTPAPGCSLLPQGLCLAQQSTLYPQLEKDLMAWGALPLLLPGLLLLLVPGSRAQKLQKLEGETIYVICPYSADQHEKEKVWCKQEGPNTCSVLATSQGWVGSSQCSLWDEPDSSQFIVIMTGLKAGDSGLYYCGFYEYSKVMVFRTIQLEVLAGACSPSSLCSLGLLSLQV